MKNGSCALRAILKRLRRKEEFLSRIVDPFVCELFFPPKALINPSAGRSFHFDFFIFNFSFLIVLIQQHWGRPRPYPDKKEYRISNHEHRKSKESGLIE